MCLHTINCAPFYFYRATPVTSGERKRSRGGGSCRKEKEKGDARDLGRAEARQRWRLMPEGEGEGDARDLGRAEARQR